MSNTSLIRTYTVEEFEALPEFDDNYELLDGKLIEKPMPGDDHGRIIEDLSNYLVEYGIRKLGRKWSQTSFDLGEGWVPMPDLAFVIAGRVPPTSDGAVKAIPDLVVEVWSPHDLDSQKRNEEARAKIKRYQEAGVRIIWAINPRNRTVLVYHPNGLVATLSEQDELDGEDVIPGFRLKVANLLDKKS